MTYLASETSKHSGKPTELYKFEGTYADFFYTSGPKKVRYPDVVGGDIYFPIAMRRSEIKCGTQDDDGLDITIELAVSNAIVQIYAFQNSPPQLDLTIYRFHEIADVKTYWTGPINDIQVSNGIATIRSPSTLGAALSANLPNVYYQSPCNHVLFDARCKMKEADWTKSATVTAIAGRVVTVNSVGTLNGKLVGGELRVASGERRMITAQNAGEIIVNFPFSQIAINDLVSVTAGCDLDYKGDCKLIFNNNKNFGGFPFIPASNPFQDGVDPSVVPLADNTCPAEIYDNIPYKLIMRKVSPQQCSDCQNCFDGEHGIYWPPFIPNGPGGKTLQGGQFTFNDRYSVENTVAGNPNLRGQMLLEFHRGFGAEWELHLGATPSGQISVNMNPWAYYCRASVVVAPGSFELIEVVNGVSNSRGIQIVGELTNNQWNWVL
jgi:hypothetical protein